MSVQTAKLAPHPRRLRTVEELFGELNGRLKSEFCLDPLPLYTIVTEGWTDVKYLFCAAELALRETGVDLLAVDLPDGPTSIGILTPGKMGNPSQGGVPQVVRLARAIRDACFQYNAYNGIALVFDHDDAGLKSGRDAVSEHGFVLDKYVLTLDPKRHPGACASKQVVIEDLLSFRIQDAYFRQGSATCSAEWEMGVLRRYIWGNQSKRALQEYVVANAEWRDLCEVARVIVRVREMWGLPLNTEIFNS